MVCYHEHRHGVLAPPCCLNYQCWTVVREELTQYYYYFMAFVEGKRNLNLLIMLAVVQI